MGNSLPSPKEVTSAIAPRAFRSIPQKVKKFAKGNITALIAKKGWKLHPRFHLKLFSPNSNMTLQSLLKFMHRNRARMASLKKLSVFLNSADILPMLMTTVSIRPLIKSLGRRLSRLRNLEAAEIGPSQMNAFSIEETLMESLSKMKKITSLTIGIPDNQNKINVIAKKLGHLKWIKKLNLNFYVQNANIKPMLNVLKSCARLQELTINLKDCSVNTETITKLGEVIKKMRRLATLVIHLENTNIMDEDLKYLYDTIENESKVGSFKINTKGCQNLTWYTRAKIYARRNMNTNEIR